MTLYDYVIKHGSVNLIDSFVLAGKQLDHPMNDQESMELMRSICRSSKYSLIPTTLTISIYDECLSILSVYFSYVKE